MVKGHVYGHLHSDSFRLSKDNGAMLLSPSLVPQDPFWSYDETSNNPGAGRLFRYDSANLNLTSYTQYYFNLTQANTEMKISVVPEYDTAAAPYSMPDLSLQSFANLWTRLKANDKLFAAYYDYNVVKFPQGACSSVCRRRHLCTL